MLKFATKTCDLLLSYLLKFYSLVELSKNVIHIERLKLLFSSDTVFCVISQMRNVGIK